MTSRTGRTGRMGCAAVATLAGLSFLLIPAKAGASTPLPAIPTGGRVVSASSSAFTVLINRTAHASRYRLFASTVRSRLYLANIGFARRSAVFGTPRVTIANLPYRTTPYYYRLEALNATKHRYSASILSTTLRPATPTNLKLTATAAGTYLTWSSGAANGFRIAQATDPALTTHRSDYVIRGPGHQFTPSGLVKGTRYYFRVQAVNSGVVSGATGVLSAVVQADAQPVRVMTYNVLEATADGTKESGNVIAPWAQRRLGVAALITQADPDVVDIQEAAAWAGAPKEREVDSLVAALGGTYALARTEIPPTEPNYHRTANYVLYKSANYAAVGDGGHWDLPFGNAAAYQILTNRTTGARFLSVSPHLIPGAGATADSQRQTQTKSLLAQAGAYAAAAHVPVIYGGDFNSDVNKNHAFDGPGLATRATQAADAFEAASVLSNQRYNSANLYLRTPPAFGQSIDHIYAPAGVAVRSWRLILNLVNGRFVGVIPSDHNPVVSDLQFPY